MGEGLAFVLLKRSEKHRAIIITVKAWVWCGASGGNLSSIMCFIHWAVISVTSSISAFWARERRDLL
mgnify:CR=1 FL=1